jgi:asparagine synthase (glutamine-hydrolysing)
MCGISCIINKDNSPVIQSEIRMINDLIIHRGPDSEGFYHGNNFAFGNRRLSVIDLSSDANQPMSFNDKFTITYNGEIYNYIEIRQQLKQLGYSFRTESDTEVILAAYDYFGIDCVKMFNGMWAFALYDHDKQIIFCSRDRFGVKPFYYSDLNDKFIIGSEIKQLLNFHRNKKVNISVLLDYLVVGYEDHNNYSFFCDISKLEQSHNLIYNLRDHTYTILRYYEISIAHELSGLNESDAIALYKNALTDSIRLRLRSDVKVGTCLSGGLDSSSIADLASKLYFNESGRRFNVITALTSDPLTDERKYAEIMVKSAGLIWNKVLPTTQDFCNNIEKVILLQEEPFGSPSVFMQFKVFERAKEIGCTVMLDGQGGDETLLGYERYYPAYLLSLSLRERFHKHILSSKNSRLSSLELLLYYFYFIYPSVRIYRLKKKFSYIRKDYFNLIDFDTIRQSAKNYSDITILQQQELSKLQLPHLLRYEDRNSMFHSIESRLPFIDYRLVETALSINNSFKIKDGWTKYLLRKSVDGIIPNEIAWRKNKLGFNAPEEKWLSELNPVMINQIKQSALLERVSEKKSILNNFNKLDLRTQWRLFNIAKWEDAFNVICD